MDYADFERLRVNDKVYEVKNEFCWRQYAVISTDLEDNSLLARDSFGEVHCLKMDGLQTEEPAKAVIL